MIRIISRRLANQVSNRLSLTYGSCCTHNARVRDDASEAALRRVRDVISVDGAAHFSERDLASSPSSKLATT